MLTQDVYHARVVARDAANAAEAAATFAADVTLTDERDNVVFYAWRAEQLFNPRLEQI